MWPPGAALDDAGAAVGSFGSVPACAEFGSAAQLLLPRSAEVAVGGFLHHAGNLHHFFWCSPFCNIISVRFVSGDQL